jgi:hypothetical protein
MRELRPEGEAETRPIHIEQDRGSWASVWKAIVGAHLRSRRQTPPSRASRPLRKCHSFAGSWALGLRGSFLVVDRRGLEPTRPRSLARVGVRSLRFKGGNGSRPEDSSVDPPAADACSSRASSLGASDVAPSGFSSLAAYMGGFALALRFAVSLALSYGGPPGTRTPNQQIKSLLLYQLS